MSDGVVGTLPGFFFHTSEYTGDNPDYQEHYRKGEAIHAEFMKRYGERAMFSAPCAADAFWSWAEAVERVGDVRDFAGIRESMLEHDYVGACATLGFDPEDQAGYYDVDVLPINYSTAGRRAS